MRQTLILILSFIIIMIPLNGWSKVTSVSYTPLFSAPSNQHSWKLFLEYLKSKGQEVETSKTKAQGHLVELKECLRLQNSSLAQALCYLHARDLLKKYPQLGEHDEQMVQDLSERAFGLVREFELIKLD